MAECPPHGYAAEPAVVRSVRALLDGELRVGAGRQDAGARSSGVGPGRHAARLGDLAALRARSTRRRAGEGRLHHAGAGRRRDPAAVGRRHPSGDERARPTAARSASTSMAAISAPCAGIPSIRRPARRACSCRATPTRSMPNLWDRSTEVRRGESFIFLPGWRGSETAKRASVLVRMRMRRVDPVDLFRLLDRLDVDVDRHRLVVGAHQHAFQRLGLRRR